MNVKEYLETKHVPYQILSHKPAYTAQKMAAAEHVPGKNVAKPVVVQADGKYYMCVVPACCKVDLDLLRQHLEAGEVVLVSEKEMEKLFPDCELGAEPPLGMMYGMTTLMDEMLAKDDYLVFQAGQHDQAVRIDRQTYESLVQPRVLAFCTHLH